MDIGGTGRWRRVEELFLQALDYPPAGRRKFLDAACSGDDDLYREVSEMLDADASGTIGLFVRSVREASASLDDEELAGRQVGPWRLVRQIGRGGMGAVYLAERADDEYSKQAAVKVIRRGMDSTELLRRFRHERQILAQLDHPYIARLLDGGTLPDGRPYFAMEYVDGKPIDDYCAEHRLGVEQRGRLFCRVCEAVSYAHRNLVVHRDLKPGNILISADGTPRLLDFGLARLMDPEGRSIFETVAQTRLLTPAYASPEQVRGLPVTTASDVYSLGAVFFELLTGKRAHRMARSSTPEEIERVVCDTDTGRPSDEAPPDLRSELRGDLDTIVLMAMRKEPDRRYASANELRLDIERYFDGRPVMARAGSFRYVAGKLLRRHALAAAAAALALTGVLGGAAVAVREARVATRERARAESRLQDLVQLANKTLFEVEDDLARQPGATDTRRKIVKATLDYLDRLAADERSDRELSLALVAGYMKMGDVLGRMRRPNLGDPKAAIASYRMASKVLDRVRAGGDTKETALLHLELGDRIGSVQFDSGTLAETVATIEPMVKEADRLAALYPDDKAVLMRQASLYGSMVEIEAIRSDSAAIAWAKKSTDIYESLARRYPDDDALQETMGSVYSNAASALGASVDRRPVTDYARKSLDVREERVRRHPDDAIARRDLMVSLGRMGDVILGLTDDATPAKESEAWVLYRQAVDVARALMRADPDNRNARNDYAGVLTRSATVLRAQDKAAVEESLQAEQEAEKLLKELIREAPGNRLNVIFLCNSYDIQGQRLERLGRLREALDMADAGYRTALPLVATEPNFGAARNRTMMTYKLRIRVLAKMGRREAAMDAARHAIALAEDYAAHGPMHERMVLYHPGAWEWQAEAGGILGDWKGARAAYVRARDEWKALLNTNAVANVPLNISRMESRIAEADSQVRGAATAASGTKVF